MASWNAHVEQRLRHDHIAYLQIAHETGFLTQYPDPQDILADYSQPVRVTPTRFLFW